MFERFPENPQRPKAECVRNVFEFFRRTAQDCRARTVASQSYDIRDANVLFIERSWRLLSIPVCDDVGRLIYLLFQPREFPVSKS